MQDQSWSTVEPTLPEPLIDSLQAWVAARSGGAEMTGFSCAQHSNDVAELTFNHGRSLMVKRGRYDWVAERFANSRAAAGVLREEAGLEAPKPLDLPADIDDRPLEVYWRIERPTLAQVWGTLGEAGRTSALRSWGVMLRRTHSVGLDGWGPLSGGARYPTLEAYLDADVHGRLVPAVYGEWPEAGGAVEALGRAVARVSASVAGRAPVLAHGDVHMGNILCVLEGDAARCVGLLDLEDVTSGVAESDLAIAEVLHGPHFNQPLEAGWERPVLDGYGTRPDPYALRFFRGLHLANLGFFSALVGDVEHAADVLTALDREVSRL